ncbi:xanthine dehydrogenase accessory protein XdhC [Terrabacter sp. GCM10028922]|uniref:xanthine dehydrogenase accessory protein XdhC n=1 Tax=Terrabacter sp. GCM10028922 TaxID=3273428 RepID=UPI00360F434B
MNWVRAVEALRRERRAGVLVTVTAVRGHAPREAGAKMVVASDDVWDTIGGGNLEATAVERARALIARGETVPQTMTMSLSDKAPSEHGQQCCGGEVTLLLEPLAVVPAVAIFGVGHVGLELARILARHDLELHLVDSRAEHVEPRRLTVLGDAVARIHVHHSPVPEVVLGQVPSGTHVLVMTHDHAEDAALCDMALRSGHLGSIGLIGSSAKWRRFEVLLRREGHDDAALSRITTPIGLPDVVGKDPATIAVSVAADLLRRFAASPASSSASASAAPAGDRSEATS